MNIVLLSGGSGKRLWPLSNDIRSKQFIKIFKTENGEYESMVQRVYRQICSVDQDASVTIATSKTQVSAIHNQLGNAVGICVEPCRRDTFPAIALSAAWLHDVNKVPEEEPEQEVQEDGGLYAELLGMDRKDKEEQPEPRREHRSDRNDRRARRHDEDEEDEDDSPTRRIDFSNLKFGKDYEIK